MVRVTATVALLGVPALAGCGGGGSSPSDGDAALTAGEVETELAAWVSANSQRSTLTGVKCIAGAAAGEFRCFGDFQASRAYAKAATGGVDASNFNARDWKLLQERHSGSVSYLVTADRTDGSFIVNPVGGS